MKISILVELTSLWGGTKVVFELAEALQDSGHHIILYAKTPKPKWYPLKAPYRQVKVFSSRVLAECDFIIATYWKTLIPAIECGKGFPVHFCQGYEGGYPGYEGVHDFIANIYKQPILTFTPMEPTTTLLKKKFQREAYTIGQGINHNLFYPLRPNKKKGAKTRVLLVGPFEVQWKGIAQGLEVIKNLKQKIPIQLIRASQLPCSPKEMRVGVSDEYHYHLTAKKMGELYRSCDLLLSCSWEQECVGLPVLEAISCGLPVVISDIEAFRAYSDKSDWATFYPVRNSKKMYEVLVELIQDPKRQDAQRKRGLQVANKFTYPKMVQNMQNILMEHIT